MYNVINQFRSFRSKFRKLKGNKTEITKINTSGKHNVLMNMGKNTLLSLFKRLFKCL